MMMKYKSIRPNEWREISRSILGSACTFKTLDSSSGEVCLTGARESKREREIELERECVYVSDFV